MKSKTLSKTAICSALLTLALTSTGYAQEGIPGANLESLLSIAKSSNPEFASMRYEADAAVERIGPAGALPDPRLQAELRDVTKMGSQSPTIIPGDVGSTRYLFTQEIPWFGKRALKREIAEFEANAAQSKATGVWVELVAKIKVAQAQRYNLFQIEVLTRENLDLGLRLERIAQARYAGGLAAQQDVIRAQMEITNMKTELASLQGEIRQANARLNALLARPANSPLAQPVDVRPIPSTQVMEPGALTVRAQAHNPLVLAEVSRSKSASKNQDLVLKNRYPDFAFGVAPIQSQGEFKEWELMVEINIPLQQSTRRSQEREAQAMLSAAEARKSAVLNQLQADIEENLGAIDAAQRMEVLAKSSLQPQSELTFNSALAGYESGKVDFSTLLDAQRQIRQAKLSQIKAQTEVQMRLAEIEKLTGEDL
jgi:outer membrane protein, heavy metal efflux system